MGVVRDDPEAARSSASATAARCADVVITSGGVSVGEADYVKEMLAQPGRRRFWRIAHEARAPAGYRPHRRDAHFFGLPGNPVSVMVTFYQFVRDALLATDGRDRCRRCRRSTRRARASCKKGRAAPNSSAASSTQGADGALERARHRRAGLGDPALDERGQLLHHPAHRQGNVAAGNDGRGAG